MDSRNDRFERKMRPLMLGKLAELFGRGVLRRLRWIRTLITDWQAMCWLMFRGLDATAWGCAAKPAES